MLSGLGSGTLLELTGFVFLDVWLFPMRGLTARLSLETTLEILPCLVTLQTLKSVATLSAFPKFLRGCTRYDTSRDRGYSYMMSAGGGGNAVQPLSTRC